jgi:hypothetical protein
MSDSIGKYHYNEHRICKILTLNGEGFILAISTYSSEANLDLENDCTHFLFKNAYDHFLIEASYWQWSCVLNLLRDQNTMRKWFFDALTGEVIRLSFILHLTSILCKIYKNETDVEYWDDFFWFYKVISNRHLNKNVDVPKWRVEIHTFPYSRFWSLKPFFNIRYKTGKLIKSTICVNGNSKHRWKN